MKFFLALTFLYDAVLNIMGIVMIIISLWFFVMWNVAKGNFNIKKIIICFIACAFIILNNIILILNIPQFTYKNACEIVIKEEQYKYPENTKIEVLDNRSIRAMLTGNVKKIFLVHKLYTIILEARGEKTYFWFNPFTGEHDEFDWEGFLNSED